jgi:hypothetical protein
MCGGVFDPILDFINMHSCVLISPLFRNINVVIDYFSLPKHLTTCLVELDQCRGWGLEVYIGILNPVIVWVEWKELPQIFPGKAVN